MSIVQKVRDLGRALRSAYHVASDVTATGFAFATALMIFFGFLKIIAEPLSPVITLAFFAALTAQVFGSEKKNVALGLGGIALYLAAWPAGHAWGSWVSCGLTAAAFGTWGCGVFRAIDAKITVRNARARRIRSDVLMVV